MIRIVHRIRVLPGHEAAFEKEWEKAISAIRHRFKGSKGALLMRSRRDPALYTAVSKWESLAQWEAFQKAPTLDLEAFHTLAQSQEILAVEIFDEVGDFTIRG